MKQRWMVMSVVFTSIVLAWFYLNTKNHMPITSLQTTDSLSTLVRLEPETIHPTQTTEKQTTKFIHTPKVLMEKIDKEISTTGAGATPGMAVFAESLATPMENASNDLSIARQVFPELSVCAKNTQIPPIVRATCAANAQRLAKKYPDTFQKDMSELEAGLPMQMRFVLKSMSQ